MADRHDDTYEDWLGGHHAQFGTPFEVIDDLVRRATGAGVARIKRIVLGESNEVHAVTSSNGDEVVVRINHNDGAAAFRRAEAVIGRARAIGIPVPDSLLIEDGTRRMLWMAEAESTGYGSSGGVTKGSAAGPGPRPGRPSSRHRCRLSPERPRKIAPPSCFAGQAQHLRGGRCYLLTALSIKPRQAAAASMGTTPSSKNGRLNTVPKFNASLSTSPTNTARFSWTTFS